MSLRRTAIARRFAAAVIAVTVLAACSAHKPAPKTGPVDPKFISSANTACESALANSAPSPFPYPSFAADDPLTTQLPKVGAYFDSISFNHDELGFVESFGNPRQGIVTWGAFVDLIRQQQALVSQQISDAKAADKAGFVDTVGQIKDLSGKIVDSATAVGFTPSSYCVQLFQ